MKTDCDGAARLLSAYLDGELSGNEREMVARHLSRCPACGKKFSALRAARTAFRMTKPAAASPWFCSRLKARLGAAGRSPRGRMAYGWEAVAVTLIFMALFFAAGRVPDFPFGQPPVIEVASLNF